MIDNRLALLPAQSVAGVSNAINNGFNTFFQTQQNTRRNQLLDLQESSQAHNQGRQNALLDITQQQNERAGEQHDLQMKAAQGAELYNMAKVLRSLPQEQRTWQLNHYIPKLKEYGFTDEQLATGMDDDAELDQAISFFSQYAPKPKEAKVGRYRQFNGEDGKTYKLDTATGEFEVIAEPKPIDISGLPDEAQDVLRGQPPEVQQKAVESYTNASNLTKQREAEEQKEKADIIRQDALRITQELLANPEQINNSVGSVDSLLPSITEGAQDFDKKLDTLRSMLTAENLKLMTGVLSESDIKILANIASGELTTKGSEREFTNALKRLEEKLGGGSDDELEGLINKYAD